MDPQRSCGTREISFVRTQGGFDELLFELPTRLVQGYPPPHQLVHDLPESPVEILLRHHTLSMIGRSMTLPQLSVARKSQSDLSIPLQASGQEKSGAGLEPTPDRMLMR